MIQFINLKCNFVYQLTIFLDDYRIKDREIGFLSSKIFLFYQWVMGFIRLTMEMEMEDGITLMISFFPSKIYIYIYICKSCVR